jgi:hypothetical protein
MSSITLASATLASAEYLAWRSTATSDDDNDNDSVVEAAGEAAWHAAWEAAWFGAKEGYTRSYAEVQDDALGAAQEAGWDLTAEYVYDDAWVAAADAADSWEACEAAAQAASQSARAAWGPVWARVERRAARAAIVACETAVAWSRWYAVDDRDPRVAAWALNNPPFEWW